MSKHDVLLIIDLNGETNYLSRTMCEKFCGNNILTATDLLEARNILQNNSVIFLIINFVLKNEESLEFIKEIRSNTGKMNSKMPILAFVDRNSDLIPQNIIDAGASRCILKPFNETELQEEISGIIQNPKYFVITLDYMGFERVEILNPIRTSGNFIISRNYSGPDRRSQDKAPPNGIEQRRRNKKPDGKV
jgi:DNA-binding response OmpR family regulator